MKHAYQCAGRVTCPSRNTRYGFIGIFLLCLFQIASGSAFAQTQWTELSTTGMTGRRFGTSAAVDGRIYLFGGMASDFKSAVDKVDIYDIATDTWTSIDPVGDWQSCWQGTAVTIGNKIYIVGTVTILGSPSPGQALPLLEFDPSNKTFTALQPTGSPDASSGGTSGAAVVLHDKLYLVGSSKVSEYDPKTNAWRILSIAPQVRASRWANVVAGTDKIYKVGGTVYSNSGVAETTDTVQVIDPIAGTWDFTLPTGDVGSYADGNTSATIAAIGQTAYLIGGRVPYQTTTRQWDLTTGVMTDLNTGSPLGSLYQIPVVANGKLYQLAARFSGSKLVGTLEVLESDLAVVAKDGPSQVHLIADPTSGTLRVVGLKEGAYSATIYNLLGQGIQYFRQDATAPISLRSLPHGTYFLQLHGESVHALLPFAN